MAGKAQQRSFSTWLDHELRRAGLELSEVARRAGISQGYLSMLKKGTRKRPARDKVLSLAAALDSDTAEALQSADLPDVQPVPTQKYIRSGHCSISGVSIGIETENILFEAGIRDTADGQCEYQVHIKLLRSKDGETAKGEFTRLAGLGETFTFRPFASDCQLTCQLCEESDQMVLKVPLRLLRD